MNIVAFRRWTVEGGRLHSTGVLASPWDAGRMTARCMFAECDCPACAFASTLVGQHDVPDENCTCGWYAYKRPQLAGAGAVGVVRLGGRMVEHERGYRAQYAQVLAVVDPDGLVDRTVYPVPFYATTAEMYAEWAPGQKPEPRKPASTSRGLAGLLAGGPFVAGGPIVSGVLSGEAARRLLDLLGAAADVDGKDGG